MNNFIIFFFFILSISSLIANASVSGRQSYLNKDEAIFDIDNIGNVSTLKEALRNIDSKNSKKYVYSDVHPNDDRKVRDENSPKWLAAVGHLNGNCSVNLVNNDTEEDSKVVTTALHCLRDYINLGKKDLNIKFTTNTGKVIHRTATVYNRGSSESQEDWAILELNDSISTSDIKPLLITKQSAQSLIEDNDGGFVTFAGYSADNSSHLGNRGKNLTYDDNCQFRRVDGVHTRMKNCFAYGGASGGASVLTMSYGDTEDEKEYYFLGHIITSYKNDEGTSTYYNTVDTTDFFDYYGNLETAINDLNYE